MERIPPDIKLIGEIIIALNVSCRNAGIYPRNHPSVETFLNRAFDLFQKLFEHREGLTLTVGKDTLIIENHYLDKKNSLYRQFADLLRKLNIAYITFLPGFTIDELYLFQCVISKQSRDLSPGDIQVNAGDQALSHIQLGFVDYKSFSVEEGKTSEEIPQEDVWEQYILGLIAGKLKTKEIEVIEKIPSDIFSQIINKIYKHGFDKRSIEKVYNIYVPKLFRRAFSDNDTKKLLNLINGLQPDLREQFLAIVVDTFSKNDALAAKSLQNVSPDLVLTLFEAIRSPKIPIPESLNNLLDKLLGFAQGDRDDPNLRGSCFIDDIYLPSDMLDMLAKSELESTIFDTFETSMSDEYQREIQKISGFSATEKYSVSLSELKKDFDDDYIDKIYNFIIFELMVSDVVSEEEYRRFLNNLKEQTSQFMLTGQYGNILQIIRLLRLNIEKNKFFDITSKALQDYYTEEFFLAFLDSLKIIGRQARDEAWQLCEFYGETIIPFLLTALANEESKTFRSLLMGFLKHFGDKIVPDAVKGLDDTRWFVKRNMFYLLIGCKTREIIPHVRPYCRHENKKVSLEAIKCLLSMEDDYGLEILREYLRSGSKDDAELAISLLSAFRINGGVLDLIQLLKGKRTSKTDLTQKLLTIQALGNIGDSRCLDAFQEILSRKSLFFRGSIEKMKEEIYKTLKNFSYEDIEDIVQLGLQSRNRYIKEESLRLSRKGNR